MSTTPLSGKSLTGVCLVLFSKEKKNPIKSLTPFLVLFPLHSHSSPTAEPRTNRKSFILLGFHRINSSALLERKGILNKILKLFLSSPSFVFPRLQRCQSATSRSTSSTIISTTKRPKALVSLHDREFSSEFCRRQRSEMDD